MREPAPVLVRIPEQHLSCAKRAVYTTTALVYVRVGASLMGPHSGMLRSHRQCHLVHNKRLL